MLEGEQRVVAAPPIRSVLITGADGRIGTTLRAGLRERYQLRVMFRAPGALSDPTEQVVIADLEDQSTIRSAARGTDAIVHLAANPSTRASFEETLQANIVGTYHVFEAARQEGVHRVVFASTNHVTGMYERDGALVLSTLPPRPDSYYGVSKAYGESLGRYYHDAHGLAVICLRIGSFLPKPRDVRGLSTWLSPRDMVQLVWRSLEASVGYGVYYGISGNSRRRWDITNAREELGYVPEDDAERFAGELG
jgi:uronate dehydrogenase